MSTFIGSSLLLSVILLTCLHCGVLGVCQPPECRIENGVEIPCTPCGVGKGVALINRVFQHCQSDPQPRDTTCTPCELGYFSAVVSPVLKCSSCVPCHSTNQDILQNCTADHDYECQCKRGSHYNNTNTTTCSRCRDPCGPDEEEVAECTPQQNRECGPKRETSPPTSTITMEHTTTLTLIPEVEKSTSETHTPRPGVPSIGDDGSSNTHLGIAIGVPICVALLIGVLIGIIFSCRSKKVWCFRGSGGPNQPQEGSSEQHEHYGRYFIYCCSLGNQNISGEATDQQDHYTRGQTDEVAVSNGHLLNGNAPGFANGNHSSHAARHMTANDSSVPLLSAHSTQGRAAGDVRSEPSLSSQDHMFPPDVRQKVAKKLDAVDPLDRNWKWLATNKLGMSQGEMDELVGKPSPSMMLLDKWEKEDLSLDDLERCLRKEMNRDDIADLLPQRNREEETGGDCEGACDSSEMQT